jgi:hypothetical protein
LSSSSFSFALAFSLSRLSTRLVKNRSGASTCCGTWARVTIDQFRHLALQRTWLAVKASLSA